MLAAVLFFPVKAEAVSARRAVVMDSVGNRVVFEKHPDERALLASTTKIMTGLIVAETCNPLEIVTVPAQAVGVEGSSMYLRQGEKLTVQELLYGLMLRSGNDAAAALAIHCSGSQQAFAELMNRKAASLGLENTHFENPHGLDGEKHYSAARDLGILGLAAMKNPIFRKTVGTKTVRIGNRVLRNHNKLLWQLPGAEGIKTGYTRRAGRILVSSCCRDGRRFTAVTMNAPDDWNDHIRLMEEAFRQIRPRRLIARGQQVGALEVQGGEASQVAIGAGEDFILGARQGEQAVVLIPGPGFVYAPVTEGAQAGYGWVLMEGTCVGRIPLVYQSTVELSRE